MVEKGELQEKILAYRILEARLDSLLKQRDMLTSKLIEIQTTMQSIEEIEKGEGGVLFPLGSEAYVFGKVTEKGKVMVEIGGGVVLEKTVEEGEKILNERNGEIESSLNAIQGSIVEISSNLNRLGPEIEELARSAEGTSEVG